MKNFHLLSVAFLYMGNIAIVHAMQQKATVAITVSNNLQSNVWLLSYCKTLRAEHMYIQSGLTRGIVAGPASNTPIVPEWRAHITVNSDGVNFECHQDNQTQTGFMPLFNSVEDRNYVQFFDKTLVYSGSAVPNISIEDWDSGSIRCAWIEPKHIENARRYAALQEAQKSNT